MAKFKARVTFVRGHHATLCSALCWLCSESSRSSTKMSMPEVLSCCCPATPELQQTTPCCAASQRCGAPWSGWWSISPEWKAWLRYNSSKPTIVRLANYIKILILPTDRPLDACRATYMLCGHAWSCQGNSIRALLSRVKCTPSSPTCLAQSSRIRRRRHRSLQRVVMYMRLLS